jgi:hypothetical protein
MKLSSPLDTRSITKTIEVISKVATKTITVDCCNCAQVGHATFSNNSLYDSPKYEANLFIDQNLINT